MSSKINISKAMFLYVVYILYNLLIVATNIDGSIIIG